MRARNIGLCLGGMILFPGSGCILTATAAEGTMANRNWNAPAAAVRKQNPVAVDATLEPRTANHDAPTYIRDVLPIFMGKCSRCHNNQTTPFLSNWLDYKTALGDRWEIRRRVWDSWKGGYYKQPMPTGNTLEFEAMTEEEHMIIKEWVDAGALYGVPRAGNSIPKSKAEKIELGRRIFGTVCAVCHQTTGQGVPNKFPPLAGSDFLNADRNRAIRILLNGIQGEIFVNGRKFNNTMPSLPLGDGDIAAVLTYVYNSFGNSGKELAAEEVRTLRGQRGVVNGPDEKNQWE